MTDFLPPTLGTAAPSSLGGTAQADASTQTPPNTSYVDDYMPPVSSSAASSPSMSSPASTSTVPPSGMPPAAVPPASASSESSQNLEDQNIFFLLGVQDANEEEKEAFLDELQQVIWEDFLENDVDLLLTEEEKADFEKIAQKTSLDTETLQSEMVEFLEKLIPDLEKIMLEKALELKEEMMRERIEQLSAAYQDAPEKLEKVKQARQLIENQQWHRAAEVLNAIPM